MAYAAAVLAGPRPRKRTHGRTPSELVARASSARGTASRLDLGGVTVLVIEDNADSRELLRQMVDSFGAKVVVAGDGREALRTVAWVKPDLILCDLRMPGLDGFGFVDTLRHHPSLSRTPVIAVTALGSDADFKKTWEAGFNGHLVKPIDYETIASQLARVFWAHERKGPDAGA
jgi:CheY-like chemotaxis protein